MPNVWTFIVGVVLMSAASAASAQLPLVQTSLVKDLNGPQPALMSSTPRYYKTIGTRVYFDAYTALTGREIFSTEGSENSLRLVADIAPGVPGSSPLIVGAAGERAIVLADDGGGAQFWAVSSDEPKLRLTSGIGWPAPTAGSVQPMAQTSTEMFWLNFDGSPLWSSDGTAAGTGIVTGAAPFPSTPQEGCGLAGKAVVSGVTMTGIALGSAVGLTGTFITEAVGARRYASKSFVISHEAVCYFLWSHDNGGWVIWRSDGTQAGTFELIGSTQGIPEGLQVLKQQLFIIDRLDSGAQARLWRTPVDQPALALVSDALSLANGDRTLPTVVDDYLVFRASSPGVAGLTIFRSDGTAAGTRRVLNENVTVGDGLFALPGKVMANVGSVWSAVDIASGAITPLGSFSSWNTRLGSVRIGTGSDGYGSEVWISDGSVAGTRRLHDVHEDNPDGLLSTTARDRGKVAGNYLYFSSAPLSSGPLAGIRHLWRSDGSETATEPLPSHLHDGRSVGRVQTLGTDVLFVMAGLQGFPRDLFRASGDFTTSRLLMSDISDSEMQRTSDGRAVAFTCGNQQQFCFLRDTDTNPSLAIGPAASRSLPVGSTDAAVVFTAANHDSTYDLWSAGSAFPNPVRIATGRGIVADSAESTAVLNGKLYFASCTASGTNCYLTFTDGTAIGTGLLAPLPFGSSVAAVRLGPHLLFALVAPNGGSVQLWTSDGTAGGTQLLWNGMISERPSLVVVGDRAHLSPACAGCADAYLITDGTTAGTRGVPLPATYVPKSGLLASPDGNAVMFTCNSPESGTELCMTDATGSAVSTLPEIFPGNGSANPVFLGQVGQRIFLGANDGRHGRELWLAKIVGDTIFADHFDASSR